MDPAHLLSLKIEAPCYIATSNVGKLREIIPMVQELFPWMNPVQGRAASEAIEDAPDFRGNALIKARALAKELHESFTAKSFYVIADDSGLIVDALGGAPGINSARYAGDHVEASEHITKLLAEMEKFPQSEQRTARYHCAIACVLMFEGAEFFEVGEGSCEGQIGFSVSGQSGFGYDPIFIDPITKKTYAELSYEEKNAGSHRQNAFQDLYKKITQYSAELEGNI